MKVALVHDWLVAHRGGEAVLLELARLFPDAPIYTLVADTSLIHPELASRDIQTSFIQRLPGAPRRFRQYLPLFPSAIEGFDLSGYDMVISTSHCVAKGVEPSGVPHLSYIHTPMRYIWSERGHYAPKGFPGVLGRPVFEVLAAWLRKWDRRTAHRPTALIANSKYVASRIKESWGRSAEVVYPPVDTAFFKPGTAPRQPYLAVVGAQVGYKNNALAIEFAKATGQPLRVIGAGPAIGSPADSKPSNITYEGHVSRERLRQIYQEASGLLFCGVEDFGIVPVEAIACGCPVVAYGEGGALESVCEVGDRPTGVFFYEQSIQSLTQAVQALRQNLDDGVYCGPSMHEAAQTFSPESFQRGFLAALEQMKSKMAAT